MSRKKYVPPPGQPSRAEFVEYARSKAIDEQRAGDQWDIWDAGDWMDGNGTAILNWKGKLLTFARMGYGAFGVRTRRISQGTQGPDDVRAAKTRAVKEEERLRKDDEEKRPKRG